MTIMVRKQIYLKKRQAISLKRQSRSRGISEAELIRQAIDHQIDRDPMESSHPDPAAWEKAHKFMLALQAAGPIPDRPRRWTREELYEERMNRYARHPR